MECTVLAIAEVLLNVCIAFAQPVTVIGPVTPGNLTQFNSPTVIKDSGVPAVVVGGSLIFCPGVVGDNSTDNSAKLQSCITTANTKNNVGIALPAGTILAPTLQATISATNIWLICQSGPGTCLLKGSANRMLSWTGYGGGAFNVGFDNAGAGTNITIDIIAAGKQFINCVLGNGIGTFINFDTGAQGVSITGLTNYNGGVGNANAPLFALNNGTGFALSGANLYTGVAAGSAAGNRNIISLSTNSFDTIQLYDNFFQEFNSIITAIADTGFTVSNLFAINNVSDGMNSGYVFVANAGGTWLRIDIQDKWISAVNTSGISFSGAGNFDNINISTKIVAAGTSGIISSATGFINANITNSLLTGINSKASGGTADGINLAGGAGYSNISIIGNIVGTISQSGTQPKNGCIFGAVIDHMTFSNNLCEGTVTNYNGMIAGTTSLIAHTNVVQFANVGLVNNSATFAANSQSALVVQKSDGSNVLTFSGSNSCATIASVPCIRSDGTQLVLNPATGGTIFLNADRGSAVTISGTVTLNTALATASGGTNCSVASGTCLDNITGFGGTGFLTRTGAGAYSFLANPLTGTNGGTGVNNGSSTITLGGNLTTSGAFNTTLTATATTNSTLPAGTHTLAGLDVAQTFSAIQVFTSNVGIGTETNPQGPLVVSKNTATGLAVANNSATFIGPDGTSLTPSVDTYNNGTAAAGGGYLFRTARGTGASPANLQNGDVIGLFGARPFVSGAFAATNTGRVVFNFTDTSPNTGTEIEFDTTPSGSTTRAAAGYFMSSGGLAVGAHTDPGIGGLYLNAQMFLPNITTSSAAQTGTVCWTTGTGKFTADTTVGCLTSLEEAKDILAPLVPSDALAIINRLNPFSFRYKPGWGDGGHYEQFGLGAHQVAAVDERLVGRDPEGTLQGVRYQELTAVLVGAIKAQQREINELKQRFNR